MTDTTVIHMAMQAMIVAAKLCAPILLTSLAVGFGISLFQAATQIQEFTLTFVPKIIAVGVVVLLSGHWMLSTILDYTRQLFASLPSLLGLQ